MKFRKKPIVIEAYQTQERVVIPTLEGDMVAEPGDWIITGVKGEKYPCKPDIFEMTYDSALTEGGITPEDVAKEAEHSYVTRESGNYVGYSKNAFIVIRRNISVPEMYDAWMREREIASKQESDDGKAPKERQALLAAALAPDAPRVSFHGGTSGTISILENKLPGLKDNEDYIVLVRNKRWREDAEEKD